MNSKWFARECSHMHTQTNRPSSSATYKNKSNEWKRGKTSKTKAERRKKKTFLTASWISAVDFCILFHRFLCDCECVGSQQKRNKRTTSDTMKRIFDFIFINWNTGRSERDTAKTFHSYLVFLNANGKKSNSFSLISTVHASTIRFRGSCWFIVGFEEASQWTEKIGKIENQNSKKKKHRALNRLRFRVWWFLISTREQKRKEIYRRLSSSRDQNIKE